MDSLPAFFGWAFGAAAEAIALEGAEIAGPPVALYREPTDGTIDVLAGFPLARPITPSGDLVAATLPGGTTVETIHTGPYESMPTTYAELTSWLTEHGLTSSEEMWEEYLVGPDAEQDPRRWQTRIVFPVA